jgi:phosphatidate phosphatase APP1
MHYVSSGPFQLYSVVDLFLKKFKFPVGSLVLRDTSKQKSMDYKHQTILKILSDFPGRKFYLVGDSGEKDIEIYEKIRTECPDQILKVFIRDVGNGQLVENLHKRANSHEEWSLFQDPEDIILDFRKRFEKSALKKYQE